jgi:dolichyl-phosphate-mannose--protein O-mannosyl transferase
VIGLVVLGVWLRSRSLGFPATFLWDEHHFVENARNYLGGAADRNDHPPLGKLIMAGFMTILGDKPEGWRAGSWVAGMLTISCGGVAAARLFRSVEAGVIAVALLAADGFLISYSRAALLDGYLALSVTMALLLVTFRAGISTALLAGVLLGATMSIKFSGVALFLPLLLATLVAPLSVPKRAGCAALLLGTAVTTYLCLFSLGLSIANQNATFGAVVEKTIELYEHHARLTDMKHPMTSGWATWALPARPLIMGNIVRLEDTRVLSSLGNLAIWWSSVLLSVTIVAALAWDGVKNALSSDEGVTHGAPTSPRTFTLAHGAAALFSLSAALGFLAPWVLSHRDSYIYHFLPIYVPLIILLSGFLAFARERHRERVLLFLVLVLLVAAFYAPVWSFMAMSQDAVRARLFLPGWR